MRTTSHNPSHLGQCDDQVVEELPRIHAGIEAVPGGVDGAYGALESWLLPLLRAQPRKRAEGEKSSIATA